MTPDVPLDIQWFVYVLTENDLLSCTKFDDGVVACNYDLDVHSPEGTGTSHHYFKEGEYYTIPYRAFIPKGINTGKNAKKKKKTA